MECMTSKKIFEKLSTTLKVFEYEKNIYQIPKYVTQN